MLFLDTAGVEWLYSFHSGELVQPPQGHAAGTDTSGGSLQTAVWDVADPHTLAALDSLGGWCPLRRTAAYVHMLTAHSRPQISPCVRLLQAP